MDADDLRDWRESLPKRSVRVRHGRDGKDGGTGPSGKDGRDGVDGRLGLRGERGVQGERGPEGRPGKDGKDGEPGVKGDRGPAGKDGRDGNDGKPGRDGTDGSPGKDGRYGKDGQDGEDGELGPIPRHELDPTDNPHRIRFELERDYDTGKTTKWGEWIDLRKLLPKIMSRGGGGGTLNERRIRELIESRTTELIEELAMDAGEEELLTAKATVTASGDTTVLTPTSGKRLVVRKIYALNDPASVTPALIKVKLLNDDGVEEWIRNYGVLTRQKRTGAVDAPVVINLSVAGSVAVTVFYEESAP